MASRLILPAAYSWQPQTVPVIAKNAITNGLIDAILPVAGGARFVAVDTPSSGNLSAAVGASLRPDLKLFTNTGGTPSVTAFGAGRKYAKASVEYSSRLSSPLKQLDECSALVLVLSTGTEASGNPYFAYGLSGGGVNDRNLFMVANQGPGNLQFRVRDSANVDQTFNATGGLAAGSHAVIVTRSEAQNFVRCYSDGRLVGSTTPTAMAATTFDRTAINALLRNTAALAQDGTVSLCLAWDRALQPAEVALLSQNPWLVFDFPSKPIFINTAASGGATVTQSAQLASSSAQYNATVAVVSSLSAPLLGSTSAQYNATVAPQIALTAPLLGSTSALYDASVSTTYPLTAPLLGSASAQYNATVSVVFSLSAPLLGSTSAFYDHTVSLAGEVNLSAPLLPSASVQYNATVSPVYALSAPLLTSVSFFYDATVSPVYALSAPLLASGSTFYSHTVTVAGVTNLDAPLLPSASAQYNATVTVVAIAVGAPLLESISQLYAPQIPSDAEQVSGSRGGWDPYYYKKRNKRRDKQKDIVEFIEEVNTPQLAQAPMVVQLQAKEALEASRLAIEEATAAARQRALVEIAEFYSLVRDAVKRRREEEDEDDLLLLS